MYWPTFAKTNSKTLQFDYNRINRTNKLRSLIEDTENNVSISRPNQWFPVCFDLMVTVYV